MSVRAGASRALRMVLQVFVDLSTREAKGMVMTADFTFPPVRGDGIPGVDSSVGRITLNALGSRHNPIFQVGTQLDGGVHVSRGLLFIDADEDRGEGMQKLVGVRLFNICRAAGRDGFRNFL